VKNLKNGVMEALPMTGCNNSGVCTEKNYLFPEQTLTVSPHLQSMQDADYIRKIRDDKKFRKAVVIGGGLIGIETCEVSSLRGSRSLLLRCFRSS
jgi:NADPH-dependent 2,4-dienoyl-CoA reductase/sulfur reductase-like enzyme